MQVCHYVTSEMKLLNFYDTLHGEFFFGPALKGGRELECSWSIASVLVFAIID